MKESTKATRDKTNFAISKKFRQEVSDELYVSQKVMYRKDFFRHFSGGMSQFVVINNAMNIRV